MCKCSIMVHEAEFLPPLIIVSLFPSLYNSPGCKISFVVVCLGFRAQKSVGHSFIWYPGFGCQIGYVVVEKRCSLVGCQPECIHGHVLAALKSNMDWRQSWFPRLEESKNDRSVGSE